MGALILERVAETLRSAGFRTDLAYPGRIIPQIRETVAAVHIRKADPQQAAVTIEVTIISPEEMGGTGCELEALHAMEALGRAGAACTQSGCSYDSRGQVYTVEILAEYFWFPGEESSALGSGVQLLIENEVAEYAVALTVQREATSRVIHEMGEEAAVDASLGPWAWKLRLEETLPPGKIGIPRYEQDFTLQLRSEQEIVMFTHCNWTSEQYAYTAGGLRRIRSGIALYKEV